MLYKGSNTITRSHTLALSKACCSGWNTDRLRLWCAFCFALSQAGLAAGQVCVPPEDVCKDATAVVVKLVDTAKCEVTVHFKVLVASAPVVPVPGTILGYIGRSITAEAPSNYTGLLPVNYQAQPVPGCPGHGAATNCTTKCPFTKQHLLHGGAHLLGFDGSHFDFQGVSGDSYSLISDKDHLINARLVKHGQRLAGDGITWIDPPNLADNATWMDTVGLTFKGDTVEVQSLPDGSIKVLANARPVDAEVDAVQTLPSNMTLRYLNMHVMDGSLWGVSGEWTLPVVTITTNRYVFEVAIPPNHQQRLDLTARLTTLPNNTAPVQEGLLGRTIGALVGLALPVQDVQPQKHQANVLDEWAKERESMQKSPTVEARLRRNYRVTNLWSKDSGRSAHEHAYQDVKFLAHATDRAKVSLEMRPDQKADAEAAVVMSHRRIQDDGAADAAESDAERLSHYAGLLCY